MKTIKIQILATALLALMVSKVFAIGGQPAPNFLGEIHASGTYFKTPPSDSWSNVNGQNSVKAAYADFDGEAFITLIAYDKQTDVALDCSVAVSKGELQLIVVNGQNEIVYKKTFAGNESIHTTLTLDVYEEYKIRFVGNQTGGAYVCRWNQQ
jgi:hypothetical protein